LQRAKAFRDEAAAIATQNLEQTTRARCELAEEKQKSREQARTFQRMIRFWCFRLSVLFGSFGFVFLKCWGQRAAARQ
jgi:hypothetical protein